MPNVDVERATTAVFAAITRHVAPSEVADVIQHTPCDVTAPWPEPA